MNVEVDFKQVEEVVLRDVLCIKYNGNEYTINEGTVKRNKSVCIENFNQEQSDFSYVPVCHENRKYYIYNTKNSLRITSKLNMIFERKSKLWCKLTRKHFWFFGIYTDNSHKIKDCDNVYLNDKKVGKVIRPLNFWKFRHLAIIKVDVDDVLNSGEIHSEISVGDANGNYINLSLKKKHKGINYYARKKLGGNYLLIRSTVGSGSIRLVNILMQPEYTKWNMFKNFVAHKLSKIIGKKNIVLMFEKETAKANESGYYVFETLMAENEKSPLNSKVYFVIDKNCNDYQKVVQKYPNNTIAKYTFRHYLYIYISKYFLSSELSNHVINPRLYIESINREIARKPLVFLQHGIMFSKPIDNPAAAGFSKDNPNTNYYKCIISSELEATQFYKKGFIRSDLIKCGLPKFDVSKQDPNADKVLIMLTYRYWEEALIMNPETIKETTYYKVYMSIIDAFEQHGMLDKLLISCHPKFADCIIQAAPKYADIVEKDVNKGIENAKIFITDYSSASYDAHYRGSYIIYYWEERDYLIENYQAIPPVNEENCDGVPVFSIDELMSEIKKAIANNYVMDPMYEERYKQINEFSDNKNGERLIKELKELDII